MSSLMASGYVHKMLDDKQDFRTFAMSCARAFGALITMRDEPADAPIPDEFKPDPYHMERIAAARATVAHLEAMSESERAAFGEKKKIGEIDTLTAANVTRGDEMARCNSMLADVRDWTPPASHVAFKEFMVEQIAQSTRLESDYYTDAIATLRAKSPLDVFNESLTAARHDITYHSDEHQKEVKRAAERTAWVRALRESLRGAA